VLIANPCYDVVFNWRRTELERLLAVFDQSRKFHSNMRLLDIPEEVVPEQYQDVLWRLLRAGAEKNILDGMDVEDDIVNEFKFRGRKPDRSPSTEPRYGSPPRPSSSG